MGLISKFKIFVLYAIVVLTVVFGVSFVFASGLVFESSIKIEKLSNFVYLDSFKLRKNIISYSSNIDLSSYELKITDCNLNTGYLGKIGTSYFFSIIYTDACKIGELYLERNGEILDGSQVQLRIISNNQVFALYIDLSNNELNKLLSRLEENIKFYSNSKSSGDILKDLQLEREFDENIFKRSVVQDILKKRLEKYITPIAGHSLPTRIDKLPNSPRPYRVDSTDGIHHGWDIDSDYGSPVIALDEGLIVRIVDKFKFSDLDKINYLDTSYNTKLKNLDILRGNQVWLKTVKGDVVFYGHLSKVANIKVGDIVTKGQYLGNVGKSGVPDKNYTDYHLHFEIQRNPYNISMIGKHSRFSYMKWDWYFKGESSDYVIANQHNIFLR